MASSASDNRGGIQNRRGGPSGLRPFAPPSDSGSENAATTQKERSATANRRMDEPVKKQASKADVKAPAEQPQKPARQKKASPSMPAKNRAHAAHGYDSRIRASAAKPVRAHGAQGAKSGTPLLVIILLVSLVGALIVLYFVTAVDSIVVVSNDMKRHSSQSIINLSGLYTGKNLYFYSFDEAEERLSSDPYIELLSIERVFPSTIRINVRERTEFAVINSMDGTQFVIDETGLVLFIGRNADTDGLIRVDGLSTLGYTIGVAIDADKGDLLPYTVTTMLHAICGRTDIASIDVSNPADVRFTTRSGVVVRIGDASSVEEKMSRAFAELDSGPDADVIYIGENGRVIYGHTTPLPTATPSAAPEPTPEPTALATP